jgi:exopolyphosphatase/guanosine-5'-triphosphate,3'-diphosphate pyrophosphatase
MVRKRTRGRGRVAVIDIGSNSVRLVVYETLSRNLVTVFNEKNLCGLGRTVQSTGRLADDAVARALNALRRFRAIARLMKVGEIYAVATAACRDASNGPDFIARAERICRVPIEVVSGPREAKLSALGVIAGIDRPDGIVGDLGGGSLELVEIRRGRVRAGVTLPLGSLTLQDASQKSPKKAERLIKSALAQVPQLADAAGRNFYAVGGTWRAFARLHILASNYPLRVMHNYSIPADKALAFARLLRRQTSANALVNGQAISEARRGLVVYAAMVLEHIIRISKPSMIVFSTYGVREGLLYEKMPAAERTSDALLAAAHTLNELLSRSARHGQEMVTWTDQLMRAAQVRETMEERRLRHASCLMSDIGWRVHPDYRGEMTFNLITNGNFASIDHAGRAFIALAVFYRYAGLNPGNEPPQLVQTLISPEMDKRARILGAAFRVAHLISAAQAGVLPKTRFTAHELKLTLVVAPQMGDLVADRVGSRLKQLAKLLGRTAAIERA